MTIHAKIIILCVHLAKRQMSDLTIRYSTYAAQGRMALKYIEYEALPLSQIVNIRPQRGNPKWIFLNKRIQLWDD